MAQLPAVRQQTTVATQGDNLLEQAQMLVKSGLLPAGIKTPEQAAAIILKGRELGIGPLAALEHVYVVKQRTGLDGQLVQALLRRDGHHYVIDEESMDRCRMRFWRKGETHEGYPVEVTWTEAQAAGWNMEPEYDDKGGKKGMREKHTWKTQRATMLMWRCLAKGARRYCADSLLNTATLPELGIDPEVDQDAEIVDGTIRSGAAMRRDRALPAQGQTGDRLFKSRRTDPAPMTTPEPAQVIEGTYNAVEETETGSEAPTQPAEPAPHWIDDPATRAKFFAWAKGSLKLIEQEIYGALGVKHLHDYKGSKSDAMNTLDAFAKAKAGAQ